MDPETLVAEHGGLVWHTVYRLLGPHADAADCFQDTFVDALRLARRTQVENWPGVLRRIATARALDRLRLRMRTAGRQDGMPAVRGETSATAPGPVEQAITAEECAAARALLARLPRREGEVMCLRYLDELPNEEIGQLLSLQPGAVAVLLHKARRRMRVWLNGDSKA